MDKRHTWHMETLAKLCQADEHLLLATPFQLVDLNDSASCDAAITWWTDMTSAGREGMVVKPLDFIAKGHKGFVQPAIKCRGPEYLRIIYGPEYLLPDNLTKLRSRAVGAKRSLARREFALGAEALERFVQQRTVEAHPRVRLRGPGPRERAGRSKVVGYKPGHVADFQRRARTFSRPTLKIVLD